MKVNLLQGTSTPTLPPMPGVHQAVRGTAARVRMLLNLNSYGRAANGEWKR